VTVADVSVTVGGTYRQPLTGASSAGYVWRVELVAGTDVVAAELSVAGHPEPHPEPQPGTHSYPEDLVITGLRPGVATVRCTLARAFEPGRPPREQHELSVTVRPDRGQ
jgi:hypothetical protein